MRWLWPKLGNSTLMEASFALNEFDHPFLANDLSDNCSTSAKTTRFSVKILVFMATSFKCKWFQSIARFVHKRLILKKRVKVHFQKKLKE